ncbi:hypothetical protein F0562_017516 [Nyssa sinensis]|uniref:Disease resistance N-terminal domain-containing protein n=1 Tax=Nyssa sinensis TaxID=561372 RepID=A0A5J4ZIA8_9ASTE|nr:hypothetical protein F0562_017516 [Nyssa sinensis]
MAETVISAVVETIFQQLGSLALREIGMAWGIKDQLIKLKNTLSTVKAVLVDAEEQQASNHEVKDWLGKLKDAAYDADDVLDEFLTEDLRRQVEIRGSIKNKAY